MNVVGFGFRRSATIESFKSAILAANFLPEVDLIAVPSDKSDYTALVSFAEQKGIKILEISQELLFQQQTKTKSKYSELYRKVDSVAEAAALAGAGESSELVVARVTSNDRFVTAAIACSHKTHFKENK